MHCNAAGTYPAMIYGGVLLTRRGPWRGTRQQPRRHARHVAALPRHYAWRGAAYLPRHAWWRGQTV